MDRKSKLWKYLPEEIRGLLEDGEKLLIECHALSGHVSDYSYLVFPFAKAYEGFLKQLFLDLGLIHEEDFYSDDIRIGRILNPIFINKDFSVYSKLKKYSKTGEETAERLWKIWTHGRNQLFHYYPHNFRRLSSYEANKIIKEMLDAMHTAIDILSSKR
ncbi:type II toxin-antitoxin system RnlA family toxin [candidate division WWE3 bacterium]|nr:type II toxin-antitoxin system RnlA family toxin [candidate division WWE3 bacterium]